MPKLTEVLRDMGEGEEAFARKHPWPAILVEPLGGEPGKSGIDTPSRPFATGASNARAQSGPQALTKSGPLALPGSKSGPHALPSRSPDSTEVMGALEAARHMARMSEAVHPDARIEWLKKSERNPFGALITLGRAKNNDIIVDHPTVSKVHVIFTQTGKGEWSVSDERSSNGTFLNGVKLEPSVKRAVSDGDSLRLGPDVIARFFEQGSLWHFGRMMAMRLQR